MVDHVETQVYDGAAIAAAIRECSYAVDISDSDDEGPKVLGSCRVISKGVTPAEPSSSTETLDIAAKPLPLEDAATTHPAPAPSAASLEPDSKDQVDIPTEEASKLKKFLVEVHAPLLKRMYGSYFHASTLARYPSDPLCMCMCAHACMHVHVHACIYTNPLPPPAP